MNTIVRACRISGNRSSLLLDCRPWIEWALLLAAGLLLAWSVLYNEKTYDEPIHLNAGLNYWHRGWTDFDNVHPPLRAIWALPALALGAPAQDQLMTPPPVELELACLLLGRMMALGLFLVWAWSMGRLVGRWIDPAVGLIWLALVLFGPTVTAHAFLMTTDMLFTMTGLLWLMAAWGWLRRPGWGRAGLLGLAAGVCLLSKFTAPLWGIGVALGMAGWGGVMLWRGRRAGVPVPASRCQWLLAAQLAMAGGVALLVVGAAYRFQGIGRPLGTLNVTMTAITSAAPLIHWVPSPLPEDYLRGLQKIVQTTVWRWAYFHGEFRLNDGFAGYFPMLIAAKPPLWLHGLLVLALAGLTWRRRWDGAALALLAVPALFFVTWVSFGQTIQIGVRHILPVFPLLMLAGAWGVMAVPWRAWRGAGLALTLGFVVTGARVAPFQLSYFNPLAGGPQGAWRWFNDSNQDWGPGWRALREYAREHDLMINATIVPGQTTGWIAVQTNNLVGMNRQEHERYRWLREHLERRAFIPPNWHLYYLETPLRETHH